MDASATLAAPADPSAAAAKLWCQLERIAVMKYTRVMSVLIVFAVCFAGQVGCVNVEPASPGRKTAHLLKNDESRQVVHRHFSADCFNRCWTLIDKKTRTADQTQEMLLLASASLWHWTQRDDCEPKNLSIAYWLLGRVHCLAGDPNSAKRFSEKCIEISAEANLPPFYLGYGYEVMADASLRAGETTSAGKYLDLARSQLAKIKDKESKDLLAADLAKLQERLARPGE